MRALGVAVHFFAVLTVIVPMRPPLLRGNWIQRTRTLIIIDSVCNNEKPINISIVHDDIERYRKVVELGRKQTHRSNSYHNTVCLHLVQNKGKILLLRFEIN